MKTEAQIMHFRKRNGDPRGGLTIAIDYNAKEHAIYVARAKCSKNDMYNRKLGRNIAQGRLTAFFDGRSGRSIDNHIIERIEFKHGVTPDPRLFKEMAVNALSGHLRRHKLAY